MMAVYVANTAVLTAPVQIDGTLTIPSAVGVDPYTGDYEVYPSDETQVLETSDKFMSDDVTIYPVQGGSATTPDTTITATPSISVASDGTITASVSESESVTPTVEAGYVASGTAGTITVSGSATSQLDTQGATTITPSASQQTAVAAGKYTTGEVVVSAVQSGTEGTPTASKSAVSNHSVTVTPSVTNTAGYISGGTHTGSAVTVSASELVSGTLSVASSGTKDVTNYASASIPAGTAGTPTATKSAVSNHALTVTPSVTNQTGFITGSTKTGSAVSVSASELVSGDKEITANASNIDVTDYATVSVAVPTSSNLQAKTNISPSTSSQTITADTGYDGLSSVQINAMPTGTAGTPTATKGAVSNHSISVTPSVTNSAGYISSGTINGTAVSVSASELDTGTKSITANGNNQDVVGYAAVNVNVPNTYAAGDEGKVVQSGALVSQTSATYTTNNTYDTTTVSSVTVNVSGGGGITADGVASGTEPSGAVTISSDVTTIIERAFWKNTGMTSLVIQGSPYTGNYCFGQCTNLVSVIAPNLTALKYSYYNSAQYTFQGCSKLETVVFPSFGNQVVDSYNFGNCPKLWGFDIYDVNKFGSSVFENGTLFTTLVIRRTSSVPQLSSTNAFSNTPFASNGSGGTLYVPSSMISSYQSASNWTTILGYANNSIKSIESTATDPTAPIDLTTHYIDGTVIS